MEHGLHMRRRDLLILAGAGVVNIAAGRRTQAAQSVIAAYGATSLYNSPIWIAKDSGLFSKYGLDTELVQLTGSRITAGLQSGSAQFISSSASSPFLANLAGGDTLLVGSLLSKVPYDVVVRSDDIKSINDLNGKTGAIALRGDISDGCLRVILKLNNLDPDKDVTIVQGFATSTDRIAALVSGSADFTVVDADFRNVYEPKGFRRLISVMDVEGADFMLSGIFSTRTYAKQNPDAVLSYLKAMTEALQIFAADKDTTLKIVAKYTSRPVAEVEPAYAFYKSIMQKTPAFDQTLVESCLNTLAAAQPKAAEADPTSFYDDSFIKKLDEEGFFKQFAQQ